MRGWQRKMRERFAAAYQYSARKEVLRAYALRSTRCYALLVRAYVTRQICAKDPICFACAGTQVRRRVYA